MWKALGSAVRFTLVTLLLFGGVYHGGLWLVGRVAFPGQAEGSLIRRADGTVVGSRLVGQSFSGLGYFHPRPSAVAFDAASTGGSNLGPSNPDQLKAVQDRLATLTTAEHVDAAHVPSEMVTASGSGIDPDLPPRAAALQAVRVAAARGVPVERLRQLIAGHTEPPALGILGRSRVNVLELNLALDEALGGPPPAAGPSGHPR